MPEYEWPWRIRPFEATVSEEAVRLTTEEQFGASLDRMLRCAREDVMADYRRRKESLIDEEATDRERAAR